jgi:hypothetical protein
MKPKTRKIVVRTIEKRLTEVLRKFAATDDLSDIKDPKEREDWRGGLFQISLSRELRSELEHALKRRPEPTHEELGKFFKEMNTLDPDSLLRPSLKHLARKLPPFPLGKQPTLSSVQQMKALADVALLCSRSGLSRKEAYRKVAKKYGLHWRTIQNLSIRKHKRGHQEAQS